MTLGIFYWRVLGGGVFLMSEVPLQRSDASRMTQTAPQVAQRSYIQGYLAHKKKPPPQEPTVGLCVGPCGALS